MSAAAPYAEYAPRPSLKSFVHCVWTYSAAADAAPQPIAPDGRPELIVHLRMPYLERRAPGDVVQPPVLFAGQITEPLTLVAQGEAAVIGVRFQPYAARAFLGADADAATNKRIALIAAQGDAAAILHKKVRALPAPEHGAERVQDYVEERLAGARVDEDVRAIVDAMFAGSDALRPEHAPERQWQRRFKAEVGVSPRMLQQILRFRRVFDAIERPAPPGWVEAALAAGYFDQPQMARDFRRFLGVSARQWAQQRAGLAKALTVSESYKK